jgi:hypothetical protein
MPGFINDGLLLTGQPSISGNDLVPNNIVVYYNSGNDRINYVNSDSSTKIIPTTEDLSASITIATGEIQSQIDMIDNKVNSINIVAGSNITVYENPDNTWTISAAVSGGGTDHNTLANLQGGTTNQYYHLTEAQSIGYISDTEVSNISGFLQSEIDNAVLVISDQNINGNKTFLDTTALSGDSYIGSADKNVNIRGSAINILYSTDPIPPAGDTGIVVGSSSVLIESGLGRYIEVNSTNIDIIHSTAINLQIGGTNVEMLDSSGVTVTGIIKENSQRVATREDTPIDGGVAVWNASAGRFDTTLNYITKSETSSVSGYLQSQIDSITAGAGATTFLQLTDTPNTYPASGQFAIINPTNDGLTFIDFRSEVENISGNLGAAIYQNTIDIQNINYDISTVSTILNNHETRIDIIETNTANLTAGLGTLLVGTIPAISASRYTITHPSVPIDQSIPVVSLTVPNSGSTIYVEAITNRTNTSFDVILSGTPLITGYSINYQVNMAGAAFIVKSYSVGALYPPVAIPDAAQHDNFHVILDNDCQIELPINMVNGQSINIMLEQDGVGSRAVSFDSGYKYTGSISSYTMTPSAYGIDVLTVLKISNRYFVSSVQNLA